MALTDKEYNAQRRRIQAIERKYHSIGIGWWKLQLAYARHPSDMPTVDRTVDNSDGKWELAASTNVAWQYRDAKITFNMESAKESDDAELEKRFLHEYAHCLVNEMRSIAKGNDALVENWIEHEESVVSHLADAIFWAYEAGHDAAPKKKRRKN